MSQYQISKKRLAQIIKEEYQSLQEYVDPRRPSPQSYEYEGAADDFRNQVMNLVIQLAPLTLEPKLAAAVELEIRDVLNTLSIGTDPRSRMRQEESKEKGKYDDGDGKDEKCDYVDCEDEGDKKVKEESLDSIRRLIQQELQNL
jgi:hypothetical protein